jgi:hypothetical protein
MHRKELATLRGDGYRAIRITWLGLVIAAACGLFLASSQFGAAEGKARRHMAMNIRGDFAGAAALGITLADVSTVTALNQLPGSMTGVFWLGNGYNTECRWQLSDAQVSEIVAGLKENMKSSGIYYISDEPHPGICPDAVEMLTRRTALIHSVDPRARTFIVVLNGSTHPDEFVRLKDAADFIGVDPYPCTLANTLTGCNLKALSARIDAALAAPIPPERLVPVFQAFGQSCATSSKWYRMPSPDETRAMLKIWDERVPLSVRPFDVVYSWGEQSRVACPTLASESERDQRLLKAVYLDYFAGASNRVP